VKDHGFQSLMKTGRPGYHIPSPETVSRDVKKVFVRVHKHVGKMLQVGNHRSISSVFLLYNDRPLSGDDSRSTREH
jgi:hypothetical protein